MATIAVFLSSYGDGGAHKNMLNIAGWLKQRGHDVDIVVAKAEGKLEHIIPGDIPVYDLDSSRTRYSLIGLWRYIRKRQPDSLLATPTTCTLVAGILNNTTSFDVKITLRIPVTLSNEPFYTDPQGPIERLFPTVAKHVYQNSERIIAISNGVKSDLVNTFSIPEETIDVIYNPAVTENIFELMHEKVNHRFIHDSHHVFIAVGRFVEQKGFDTLIKSFKKVSAQTNSKLIILGDGRLREDMIAMTEDMSISNDVSFPGFVKNPYKYIHSSDTFVLSSRWEGFGNVVAEALACGTPVIATDCESGPSEILNGGEYGRLVPVDDVNQLADAMNDSLSEEVNKKRLQDRALDFHIENIAPKYETVLLRK